MTKRKKTYKENIFVKFVRILLLVILSPVVLIYLIVNFLKKLGEKKSNKDKVAVFNMSQIDSLSGSEFETFLKTLFEKLGYSVSLTKKSHDYGADLIIQKKNETSIVQAKCYGKTVGIKAIQEIVAAKTHYGANSAIVATNNYFSKDAVVLATENNIRLLDRDVIERLVKKFNIHIDKEKKNICAISKKAVYEIESKYRFWI